MIGKKIKMTQVFRDDGSVVPVTVVALKGVGDLDEGTKVKVTGVSKGKGFAGVVKRFGFAGGPKTHGQSDRHRAPGSIGGGTDPGRVWKGKKMAGRMGGKQVSVRGLEVIKVEPGEKLVYLKGAIPGRRQSEVRISKLETES